LIPWIALFLQVAAAPPAPAPSGEEAFYAVDHLRPPDGVVLEVGGMAFLPDGRLALSTRRGEVWIVEDPLADDPAKARFHRFAEGLWEGLGLAAVDGDLFVVQRSELSRLRDLDGDGLCDEVDTLCDDWGLSGNYHEFAYGLPVDAAGNFYVSLNVAFFNPKWWHGESPVPWRGWIVRIAPDGRLSPFACGLRSPCGLGQDGEGRLLVTDNQGDWVPACPIYVVHEGDFLGHPASLAWTPEYRASHTQASDTIPPERASTDRRPAAIWIPYEWSRSAGNLVVDASGGRFGPFDGQLFVAELTNGMVLRAGMEEVQGEMQGWVLPFRQRVGSAVRVLFAPDGTLLAGFTNRGWGGFPPADGIARLRWTGRTPFEIQSVHLLQDGFEIGLTLPLADGLAVGPGNARVRQYDYDYWWEYGSPDRSNVELPVSAVELSPDRRTLTVHAPGLAPAMVARLALTGLASADGQPLLHPEVAYTVNQLPAGERTSELVAKVVPPPPARESDEEGWLRLTYGDAFDAWTSSGWELCDAELDPADPTQLVTGPGVSALTDTAAEHPSAYVGKLQLGDGTYHVEFLLPREGRATVWIQGRYGIRLADGEGLADSGALLPGGGSAGRAPDHAGLGAPGTWHALDVEFRAPRFAADGTKAENARLASVSIDDTVVQRDVLLPGPSDGARDAEAALGPLVVTADTEVAIGNVRHRPAQAPEGAADAGGWTPLVADDSLAGWTEEGEGIWSVDDGALTGEGPPGWLVSERGDLEDFELRARVKVSDGGDSGILLRAETGAGAPHGYEVELNSSFADPEKTGSVLGLAPVRTHFVAPDTWCELHVTCRGEKGGTRVVVRLDGVVVNDFLDAERRFAGGHIALQQHHEGSVVEIADLAVRAP